MDISTQSCVREYINAARTPQKTQNTIRNQCERQTKFSTNHPTKSRRIRGGNKKNTETTIVQLRRFV
ncbi:hypothetical protein HY485_02245 [Candidatus Woesearchaeota archaeon]|nr:hypothetical protein [Candidatus Woesearchaeota archaeon]